MSTNSAKNQEEDCNNVWQKVYRIIALILLASMFLYWIDLLMAVLGISFNGLLILLSFPFPLFR